MARAHETDVAIVGAGTTGAYLAWRLSEAGFGCTVVEGDSLDSLGTRIGPFHMEDIAFDRFSIPRPEGRELLHTIEDMTMYSPGRSRSVAFKFEIRVMDKPSFIRRLHGYAVGAGAEIHENTRALGVIEEGGAAVGLYVEGPGGASEIRARLIIDASGIDGAVRTSRSASRWFESDRISDEDTIYVYMETWEDVSGELLPGVSSYPDYQGWCAPGPGESRIVGIGAGGSVQSAVDRHRRFVRTLPYTGTVVGSTTGRVPYRRPPYSLVDNGFAIAGDAAFMNKPFNGEGVASAFAACDILIEVAGDALATGNLTRDFLWAYNVGYFRNQGAKFAFLTAALPGVMGIGGRGMEAFFEGGLLTQESSRAMQVDFEVMTDTAAAFKSLPSLARAVVSGDIPLKPLAVAAAGGINAGRLKKWYEKYPEHPADFGFWANSVAPLWRRVDETRRRYFRAVALGE